MSISYRDYFDDEGNPITKYWGSEAAGCIFVAKDTGLILLAHRSKRVKYDPSTWGTWGGAMDGTETPKQAIEREVKEETGFSGVGGKYTIHHLWDYEDTNIDEPFIYHNYMVIVDLEFTPKLNWENDDSKWVAYGQWPEPLHWGMKPLIEHAGHKIKRVIDLIDKKREKLTEAISTKSLGLEDVDTYGYELKSPFSYLRFSYDKNNNTFFLRNIGTAPTERNKGYATQLLEIFIRLVKDKNGVMDPGVYTGEGKDYVKHVVERLARQYGVRLI